MKVDVHSHIMTEDMLDYLAAHPEYGNPVERDGKGGFFCEGYGTLDVGAYDVGLRLETLKSRGIDRQLVGPLNTLLHWPGGAPDVAFSRYINADTVKAAAQGEGRLEPMAAIAFGEPENAADELRRAVGEHGFRGAHVGISAGSRMLDHPVFEPVWDMAERLQLFLFMHPANHQLYERCLDYTLTTMVAWPTETCIAVSRMIFAGVFERHPGLRLCLAHGGGTLPYLANRLNRGYDAPHYEYDATCHEHISKPPSEYLKQLYFDSVVLGEPQLDFLYQNLGPGRMMLGTDFPFEIGDAEARISMPWIDRLPDDERDAIYGGNVLALLDEATTD